MAIKKTCALFHMLSTSQPDYPRFNSLKDTIESRVDGLLSSRAHK